MKKNAVTKTMAIRNARLPAAAVDPFRPRPRRQARFNQHPVPAGAMPPSSQLRYPVFFAVMLCFLALGILNFAMMA